jgi:hypothetical protein
LGRLHQHFFKENIRSNIFKNIFTDFIKYVDQYFLKTFQYYLKKTNIFFVFSSSQKSTVSDAPSGRQAMACGATAASELTLV